MNIIIVGYNGKMAKSLAKLFRSLQAFEVVGYLAYKEGSCNSTDLPVFKSLKQIQLDCYTLIDFSNKDYTEKYLEEIGDGNCCSKVKILIGTSGLTGTLINKIEALSTRLPIFYSPNFSIGVFIMNRIADMLIKYNLTEWEFGIYDFHHARKKDTPSATALALAEKFNYMPDGCPISCMRLGDGVSEHTIYAHGVKERLDICHRVIEREAFYSTIVKASNYLESKKDGLYGMSNLFE